MYSDESLTQKYRKNAETVKQASPPLDQTEKMNPKLDEYAEKVQRLLGSERPLLGNQMSSNHWVVHGNHTETGMPLFASDPHLENQIPSTSGQVSLLARQIPELNLTVHVSLRPKNGRHSKSYQDLSLQSVQKPRCPK